MYSCQLISTSRDLVGNTLTANGNIFVQETTFKKVADTIEVEIENGASFSEEEIIAYLLSVYELYIQGI